jgi:hypothetical protein
MARVEAELSEAADEEDAALQRRLQNDYGHMVIRLGSIVAWSFILLAGAYPLVRL